MRHSTTSRSSFFVPSFSPLRASIWAVLGLSAAACGGNVTVEGSGGSGGSLGTGGSGSTTTTTSGTGGTASKICEGSKPIPQQDGSPSGFEMCPDGTIHRAEAVACNNMLPACGGTEEGGVFCASDADCQDAPNGFCAHYEGGGGGGLPYCSCAYPCTTDADCGGGQACVCAGVDEHNYPWAECSGSPDCLTDADCPQGECALSTYNDGCGIDIEMSCRAPGDACRTDAECQDFYQCVTMYSDNTWMCATDNCAVGRPLVVEGAIRKAGSTARRDWLDRSVRPDVASVPAAAREAMAAYWREVAALEHASIGSFARFSLELLALGAPAELLMRAAQAGADEVVHAELAFSLASAFGGEDLGPCPLDMTGVAPSQSVEDIVTALVHEACVGETIGAAEARALAQMSRDPALSGVYTTIAEDEARHAELGWRALAWLLRSRGPEARAAAERAFAVATAAARIDPDVSPAVVAPEHGLLSGSMLGALRRQVIREVIEPCAAALLSEMGMEGSQAGAREGAAVASA